MEGARKGGGGGGGLRLLGIDLNAWLLCKPALDRYQHHFKHFFLSRCGSDLLFRCAGTDLYQVAGA